PTSPSVPYPTLFRSWPTLRHITLPQLRTTTAAVLLLNLIAAYQAFDEFYNVLGSDGAYPPYARPPLVYLYYTALGSGQDFGRGTDRKSVVEGKCGGL